jgi:hypothetical protein
MKEKIMIKLICDSFMFGLVLAVQAMTANSLEQVLDDAAQTALNEHPNNQNIDELVGFAGNFIRMQLSIPY